MSKTVQKLDITEVKVYKCSDGSTFDSYDKAKAHETELKEIKEHPDLALQRITELESRVLALETKITVLTSNPLRPPYSNPWEKPQPYFPAQNPAQPYQGGNPKPGDVLYEDKEHYQRVVMGEDGEMKVVHTAEDDERAFADGKTVVCAGHNRVVIDGPITEPNPFAPNKQYFDWENSAKSKEIK